MTLISEALSVVEAPKPNYSVEVVLPQLAAVALTGAEPACRLPQDVSPYTSLTQEQWNEHSKLSREYGNSSGNMDPVRRERLAELERIACPPRDL